MGKKVKWSWVSALINAASAMAVTAIIVAKPKNLNFHLISINLTSFKLNFPVLDIELIPIVHLAHHVNWFFSDVAKREMVLGAVVDIEGTTKVLWWDHKFKVHVDSRLIVDPVFLDVIDQEHRSELEIFT
ncbi:Late embryogenesis abundant (LEA) hydroxyproline-rich glycoprotein family [Parasponia andersonii]|uniref:Late embryogenesis abundant (LEA) hydroxyproline-rich glycoprotein family n=1 Tax=Parasponia andersonii TaxID=3476 RepID=A0A2P5CWK2_PARAD|nr:Late embryogenesis abundant (LEA) hydroxyproline-rich glycoprotein family [Parasponia andersonii]